MQIKIVTLGCAKNLVDSEYLAAELHKAGHQLVEELQQAEAVLVNTCGFIQAAKEEALDVIFELIELKRTGKIKFLMAGGCLIERYAKELRKELPEVDVFLPFNSYTEINRAISGHSSSHKRQGFLPTGKNERHRLTHTPYAYLKVSEGCNNNCTYCAIPLIRGTLRSRPLRDILKEAASLAEQGIKELVVLGQDTTSYGYDRYRRLRLPHLLKELIGLRVFPRIRLMYTHPAHYTQQLIELVASEPTLLPYLDLPLQHINERILKRMNRSINKQQILSLIRHLRRDIPDLVLRTTFIVGFPGETEPEFEELHDFVKQTRFERLGVFAYSREEDTPAARMRPHLDELVKENRLDQIMRTQQEISLSYQQSLVGKTLEVLVEQKVPGKNHYLGRGYMDAPEVDGQIEIIGSDISLFDMIRLRVVSASTYDLKGEIVVNP